MDGRMDGSKSHFKDCLQQSKNVQTKFQFQGLNPMGKERTVCVSSKSEKKGLVKLIKFNDLYRKSICNNAWLKTNFKINEI